MEGLRPRAWRMSMFSALKPEESPEVHGQERRGICDLLSEETERRPET